MSLAARLKRLKAEADARTDRHGGVELWTRDPQWDEVWRCEIASTQENEGQVMTEAELARRFLRIPAGSPNYALCVEGWPMTYGAALQHARDVLRTAGDGRHAR